MSATKDSTTSKSGDVPITDDIDDAKTVEDFQKEQDKIAESHLLPEDQWKDQREAYEATIQTQGDKDKAEAEAK